jgi:lipopolysaccharide transport system permease protein
MSRWFLLENLVLKDFRIRYRNMSLGILWSVANPLLMMGLLTFVFTCVYPNRSISDFALFVLCALVPYHFYSLALSAGTTSLWDNEALVKRSQCPPRIFPIAAVLSNCLHFPIQISLLLGLVLLFGYRFNRYWPLLAVAWLMEVLFMCGLTLITAALDVFYRDIRYLAEASGMVMFWLVPVFYSLEMVPHRYHLLFIVNPIAAVALADRAVLLHGQAPAVPLMVTLSAISLGVFLLGLRAFSRLERNLADYL